MSFSPKCRADYRAMVKGQRHWYVGVIVKAEGNPDEVWACSDKHQTMGGAITCAKKELKRPGTHVPLKTRAPGARGAASVTPPPFVAGFTVGGDEDEWPPPTVFPGQSQP